MSPHRRSSFVVRAILVSTVLCAVAACSGGGDKGAAPKTDSVAPTPEPAATVAAGGGEAIYARCSVCHQTTGLGLPGTFPPLAGSELVTGPSGLPIRILLHGLQGPVTVKGATYNGMMPPGGGVPMTDQEIADVLTYVRSSFGNAASAVTVAEVAAVRAETASRTGPWTAEELEKAK